ncbi:hypothetical protein [Sphingobacterium kitahiroshimense]|uniref:Uncharacterized protein n=1 Tax=Sphingobacterium kitahiroshimense TaxID=470446 RepID=A0ABV0BVG1_9SPHI
MAEIKSKYELKSPEVQEVMNKPSHFFINWGNLLIIISISFSIFLINKIQIKNYDRLLATIISEQMILDQGVLVIKLNLAPKDQYPSGLETQITFLGDKSLDIGTITGTIDSFWNQEQNAYISWKTKLDKTRQLRLNNNQVIVPANGMNVSLKITTSKEDIIESMIKKLIKR